MVWLIKPLLDLNQTDQVLAGSLTNSSTVLFEFAKGRCVTKKNVYLRALGLRFLLLFELIKWKTSCCQSTRIEAVRLCIALYTAIVFQFFSSYSTRCASMR